MLERSVKQICVARESARLYYGDFGEPFSVEKLL